VPTISNQPVQTFLAEFRPYSFANHQETMMEQVTKLLTSTSWSTKWSSFQDEEEFELSPERIRQAFGSPLLIIAAQILIHLNRSAIEAAVTVWLEETTTAIPVTNTTMVTNTTNSVWQELMSYHGTSTTSTTGTTRYWHTECGSCTNQPAADLFPVQETAIVQTRTHWTERLNRSAHTTSTTTSTWSPEEEEGYWWWRANHQLYPVQATAMGLRESQCPRHHEATATTSTTTSVDECNEWVLATGDDQEQVEDGEILLPITIVEEYVITWTADDNLQQVPQRFDISDETTKALPAPRTVKDR
jgi:hypothetical protein